MASADEAHSRPKRPAAMTRQSSSQSHISQSPSEGYSRPAQHKPQRHVVGQRVQRNTSFGKNLNKLNKAAKEVQQAAENTARHHRRSQSGNSVSAPSSPRPSFKRNASSGGIVRVTQQAQAQANLRKNHSSGHLARQGHAKHALKTTKSEVAAPKRSLGNPNRSRQSSPEPHPSVHFDMASDEEGGDDGWTEESASQSPNTTRSNTRSNSVILEAQHKIAQENMENNRGEPSQVGAAQSPPAPATQTLTDRTRSNTRANGGSSQQHSRPPDADMITSRLLQRSASHNVPPQTSSVAATVVSSSDRHNLLSHSAGSTLVDTPGRDLVSRFMDGEGSAGTPKDGGYMPSRGSSKGESGDLDQSKRNKSMPNVSGADTPSRTHQRSGTSTPTNLPPSRTQQKLMLQRASSNIEPQKLVPVTLPRTGGPNFMHSGIHYNVDGEGRLDPRLQQQFNHVAVEYKVVRRYRNPLADAFARIQQIPGMSRKTRITKSAGTNGYANVHAASNLSTSFNEAGHETDGAGSRRSRVSFENDQGRGRTSRDEGDFEGRQSFESDQARSRNEAEEICRRLWESAEVVEAD
ncbi:Nn.00g060890.m01.CDS01 [Neocucurbitaria sp. VM-36]